MSDRDERGRFVPGNKAAVGKPPKEYADAIKQRVPLDKWEGILDRTVQDALNGDHNDRVWLADRLIGKPPQVLDLQSGDLYLLRELIDVMRTRGISFALFVESSLEAISEESLG